jgi:hypothetical protein
VVIALVSSTLADLRLAIAGTIALSTDLAEALDALAAARVPRRWGRVSWEASGAGAWFSGLLARHDQLARWLTGGRPKSYWMGGFFNPQGFITAGMWGRASVCGNNLPCSGRDAVIGCIGCGGAAHRYCLLPAVPPHCHPPFLLHTAHTAAA